MTLPIIRAVADETYHVISSHSVTFSLGDDLRARFPALPNASHSMSYNGDVRKSLSDSLTLEYDKECRVFVIFDSSAPTSEDALSFDAEYDRAVVSDSGAHLTQLYERFVLRRPRSYLRFACEQPLLPIICEFMNEVAPRLRTIKRGIFCRIDGSVDDGSAVLTKRREFIFALSAMCAAVGYASSDTISVEVEHYRSEAVICVSASIRSFITGDGASVFGVRAADAVFAVHTLHSLGHRVKIVTADGNVSFSLSARAGSYYPSELKQRYAKLLYALPGSAYEQYRKHDEQLIIGSAAEEDDNNPDKNNILGADFTEQSRQ